MHRQDTNKDIIAQTITAKLPTYIGNGMFSKDEERITMTTRDYLYEFLKQTALPFSRDEMTKYTKIPRTTLLQNLRKLIKSDDVDIEIVIPKRRGRPLKRYYFIQ
jgi:predicted ArsR family transcriptional regulator